MNYTSAFITRVNELFHDYENCAYNTKHPEIFGEEEARWELFSRKWVEPKAGGLTVLDFGSGTGFVASCIAKSLLPEDHIICADLSGEMLKVCRERLESSKHNAELSFLKLNNANIELGDLSCDIICLNSVLHHLPEFTSFFAEADRILKPGGILAIGHEPNALFFRNVELRRRYEQASWLLAPTHKAKRLLLEHGLGDLALRLGSLFSKKMWLQQEVFNSVNQQLLKEGLIADALSIAEIISIVDFHSPTAGGLHIDRGINIQQLARDHVPDYTFEWFETYNHLDKISNNNTATRALAEKLKRQFPDSGATLFAVLRKG